MTFLRSLALGTAAFTGLAGAGAGALQAAPVAATLKPMNALVQAVAKKFNLNAADVQKIFDEQRDEQGQARETARLAQAVKNGTLTQAQADLLKAKHAEMRTFAATLKDKTREERAAALKTQGEAFAQWATQNGIPAAFASLGGPGFAHDLQNGQDLAQAVKDGKLTQAQADALKTKRQELKTALDALKDKTAAERQAAIKAQGEALAQWAKDNGIDEVFARLPQGGPGNGARGMMRGDMRNPGPRGGRGGAMGGPRGF